MGKNTSKGVLFILFLGLATLCQAQDKSAPYYQAGNNFYSQQNYDQAIRYYQYAAQLNPQLWQAYQGLGNCYYAKGDKATALTNYQKALAINPNNPQLSSFTQSLQAQVGSSPAAPNNSAMAGASAAPSSSGGAGRPEFDVMAGANMVLSGEGAYGVPAADITGAGFAGGYGLGFGGGVGLYFPVDKTFMIGGNAAFYAYGTNYTYSTGEPGVYSEGWTITNNQSNIEFVAAAKMKLGGGGNLQPYLLGGLGFSMVSSSGSVTEVETEGGTTVSSFGYALPSSSAFSPMVQVGGGVQFPMGNNMNFFGEAKFNLIFVGGSTYTVNIEGTNYQEPVAGYTFIEFPIDIGLNFNL
jgi:hypothetical protein